MSQTIMDGGPDTTESVDLILLDHVHVVPADTSRLWRLMYLLLTTAAVLYFIEPYGWLPARALQITNLVLVGPWVYLLATQLVMLFRGKRRSTGSDAPPESDARLRVAGRADELQRLSHQASTPFQPVTIRETLPVATFKYMGAGIMCMSLVAILSYHYNGYNDLVRGCGCSILLIPLAIRLLFPLHYRIAAGQMDVVRLFPFTTYALAVAHWDLRTTKISVRFDKHELLITSLDGRRLKVWLMGVSEPYRFVEALLLGAGSGSRLR